MATDEFHEELTALFEAEDAELALDPDAFAKRVDRRIGRQLLLRRIVLMGATLIGGLVAGTQVPDILMQVDTYGGFGVSLFDDAAEQMRGQSFSMVIVGFAAVVSTVTILSQDRI